MVFGKKMVATDSIMKRGLVKSSRYSPGNMDGESLHQLFVGRRSILVDVVNKIRLSATTEQKHYILLVGPRGCGKTHFVALAYHQITSERDKTPNLQIAFLNEEEWGVASYLDFLVRILRSLFVEASTIEASEIETIYEKFASSPEMARDYAESLIRKVVGEERRCFGYLKLRFEELPGDPADRCDRGSRKESAC